MGLLVLGPILMGLLLATSWLAKLDGPRLPAQLEWNGQHWQVVVASSPLEAADEVVQIEGRPVGFATLLGDPVQIRSRDELVQWLEEKSFLFARMKSGPLQVEVVRHGVFLPLVVTPARASWKECSREGWVELVPACAFLWAGWTTLARARRRPESAWFCLMCLLTCACYLSSIPFRPGLLIDPTLLLVFLAVNLTSFLFGPAALLHVTLLVPERSIGNAGLVGLYSLVVLALLSLNIPLQVALVGTLYAAVLLAVVWSTWRYRSSVHRQQMKWIWAGYVLGLTPGLLFNGLPLLLGGQRIFEDAVVGFFLVCIPWFYSLAIQRYRLFDIETLAEGSLVYVFTLSLICLLEISLLSALGGGLALPAATVILMAAIASSYGVVHRQIAKVFHRSEPDVVQRFQSRASGCGTAEILSCLLETLQEWPAPQSLQWIPGRPEAGCTLCLAEPVTVEMQLESPQGLSLGPLPGGQLYNARVISRLDQLARQAALLYQNAHLFEEEVMRRENALQERERLLNDLHDGVGASLATIRMTSRQLEVSALAGDALFELQHFLYDGLEYTMTTPVLAAELRSYGNRTLPDFGLQSRLQVDDLNRSTALKFFRHYRETLQQCVGASRVRAELEISEKQLLLTVETDDGRRFGFRHLNQAEG